VRRFYVDQSFAALRAMHSSMRSGSAPVHLTRYIPVYHVQHPAQSPSTGRHAYATKQSMGDQSSHNVSGSQYGKAMFSVNFRSSLPQRYPNPTAKQHGNDGWPISSFARLHYNFSDRVEGRRAVPTVMPDNLPFSRYQAVLSKCSASSEALDPCLISGSRI
jgi:hypothetical protein